MKQLFLILALLFVTTTVTHAQQYKVYSVKGTVKLINGKKIDDVKTDMNLAPASIVKIGNGSELVIIDTTSKKQYTCKQAGTTSVEKLISAATTSTKQLTAMYFTYLLNQITSKAGTGKYADDVTASLERTTNDSVFSIPANESKEYKRQTHRKNDSVFGISANDSIAADSIK